jgi:disulfide bond formation protein DsbB
MFAWAVLGGAAMAHEGEKHAAGPGLFGEPPEYVHVLLNPLPVYGLGLGTLALAAALFTRSRAAKAVALGLVVFSSGMAWPVVHYGQNAYDSVRGASDDQGRRWLNEHMERAEKYAYAFYVAAILGVLALISLKQFPKAATPLALATLIAALVSLGIGSWISRAGGQIRHPEFRHGPAPTEGTADAALTHSNR